MASEMCSVSMNSDPVSHQTITEHSNHTASAMSALIFYISRHPLEQRRLQGELVSALGDRFSVRTSGQEIATGSLDLSVKLASLPYLDAVIHESLRLRLTPPAPNARITSQDVTTIGPFRNIPAGTRIQTYPWVMHRDERYFPDAETWDPERWLVANEASETGTCTRTSDHDELDTRTKGTRSSPRDGFWGFGSGARGCPGRSMSLECEYSILSSKPTWSSFRRIAEDSNEANNSLETLHRGHL